MNKSENPLKAFPTNGGEGMTLRDYFAAHALQGLLSSLEDQNFTNYPEWAYQIADDMLVAREA